ncbi:tetratricopeptide repeat protein [Rheinheimera sp. MMS21-TC3]|uniref:tetratricopeptide repeat protein n=1 Tax=Rheinheimera sp. MMS21-TC3 TaxID=3072790 RepID=UPI0028C42EDB|nr:tetratricopeptide repeat protein [Rheinheimera sp. MMS21-TC3]WNO62130.1 tetratricopeptide repeat protein [Rheinheimera sp. MMS21-TC3]
MRSLIFFFICCSFLASASDELEPRLNAAAIEPELISQQLLQNPIANFTARDLIVLAETQIHLRNKDAALDAINKAIALADSVYLSGHSYLMKAKIYGILFRDTPLAITQLQLAEQLLIGQTSRESKSLYGDVLQNFAQAYNQLGQPNKAMPYAKRSLDVALDLQHANYELRARIIIGRLALPNNDYNLAYSQFTQALKLASQLNDQPALASIHFRLGKAFLKIDDTQSALEHFQQALPLYKQLQRKGNYTYTLVFIAEAHLVEAENSGSTLSLQLAKDSLAEALTLAREQDDVYRVGLVMQSLAKVAILEKQPQQAIKHFSDAIQLFQQQNFLTTAYEASINLAEVLYDNNQQEQATVLLNKIEPEITQSAAFMHYRFYSLMAKIAADNKQWQRAYTNLNDASNKRFEQISEESQFKLNNIKQNINENSELKRQLDMAQQEQLLYQAKLAQFKNYVFISSALLISLVIISFLWRYLRLQQRIRKNKTSLFNWSSFCQQVQKLENKQNMTVLAIQLHASQQLKLQFGELFYHQLLESFLQNLPAHKYLVKCRELDTLWLALDQNTELEALQQALVLQLKELLPTEFQSSPIVCMSFILNQLIKKPWSTSSIAALPQALWLGHYLAAENTEPSEAWLLTLQSTSPNACEWTSIAIRKDLINSLSLGSMALHCNGEVLKPNAINMAN